MSWILFSILATLMWALANVIDKYILTKWIRNPTIPVMIAGAIGLIASFLIYLFHGYSQLSLFNIFLSFIAGLTYVSMLILYFKALKIGEVSRVIPLFYLTPLFILLFATLFLDEVFTPLKYFGIFLLIIGTILISSKKLKITFGKVFWFIILADILIAINQILTKYLLNFADFWTIFSYIRIGSALVLIPIFFFSFPELVKTVKRHGNRVIGVISISESLTLFGILLITIAASVGYITLVNALSSVQPFFVLLFAVILSIFYPKILKEEIGRSTVILKLVAIVMMFVGAMLII